MATQDDKNVVATADALLREEVGRLVRPLLHVAEGEEVLFAFGVAPYHGAAIGVVHTDVVYDVVAEVEILGANHVELSELVFVVVLFLYETKVDVSHNIFPR